MKGSTNMNSVELIGRLTKDPEVRYTSGSQMAVATLTVAIDRPSDKNGQKQTDFPRVIVFGKQAENCEKYLKKGRMIAVQGRIQTGSYKNKDGDTVYTTDVAANRIEFIDWGDSKSDKDKQEQNKSENNEPENNEPVQEEDFEEMDEDVPF